MSRRLTRRRVRAVPPAPSVGVITGNFYRWASGTGSTLMALGTPLEDGDLLPANLANVSVWRDGVEVAAFVKTMGLYPSGYARTLYHQTLMTATNGSPVSGEIRLTGGFTVARRTLVDTSASLVNTGGVGVWQTLGFPDGAFVPNDSARNCRAMLIGPLIPKSGQPVFTGSTGVDAQFVGRRATATNWQGGANPSADYNHGTALVSGWARDSVAEVDLLKLACSDYTKMRTSYWLDGTTENRLPEPRQSYDTQAQMAMLLNDQDFIDRTLANFDTDTYYYFVTNPTPSSFYDNANYSTRVWSKNLAAFNFALTFLSKSTVYDGETLEQHALRWLAKANTAPLWNGNVWTSPSDGGTSGAQLACWQNMMIIRQIARLFQALGTSATMTTALANAGTALEYIRVNCLKTTYGFGEAQFLYYVPLLPTPDFTLPPNVPDNGSFNVDLNGFFAPIYAWNAARTGNVTHANLARTMYRTCGLAEAADGPYLTGKKQWDEVFHDVFRTMAYLQQAGI